MSTIYDYSIPTLPFEESCAIVKEVFREVEKDVKLNKNCARDIAFLSQRIFDVSFSSNQPSNEYKNDKVDSVDINDVSKNSKTPSIPIINLGFPNNGIWRVAKDVQTSLQKNLQEKVV